MKMKNASFILQKTLNGLFGQPVNRTRRAPIPLLVLSALPQEWTPNCLRIFESFAPDPEPQVEFCRIWWVKLSSGALALAAAAQRKDCAL